MHFFFHSGWTLISEIPQKLDFIFGVPQCLKQGRECNLNEQQFHQHIDIDQCGSALCRVYLLILRAQGNITEMFHKSVDGTVGEVWLQEAVILNKINSDGYSEYSV